jgi:ribosomal protein L11 methyltransferase
MGRAEIWCVEVGLPELASVEPFEAALASDAGPVTISRAESGGWRLAVYAEGPPNRADVTSRIAVAAASIGIEAPGVTITPVPDIDWVSHVHARTPPIKAGRFYVHGSHVTGPVPDDCVPILMDGGPAFGTGDHQSTRGCLVALDKMSQDQSISKILDLGCGSGILSIAAARIWPAEIIAADFDADAVAMTTRCAEANGVAGRIAAIRSRGFQNAKLRAGAPFDLVLANILARPLMRLAPAIARHLAPGGRVVLSGLLAEQGPAVLDAYGGHALTLADRIEIGEWLTLVMLKRG